MSDLGAKIAYGMTLLEIVAILVPLVAIFSQVLIRLANDERRSISRTERLYVGTGLLVATLGLFVTGSTLAFGLAISVNQTVLEVGLYFLYITFLGIGLASFSVVLSLTTDLGIAEIVRQQTLITSRGNITNGEDSAETPRETPNEDSNDGN